MTDDDRTRYPQAKLRTAAGWTLVARDGALPGAANWTHEHADAANTRVSKDKLVKAPLGVLWFGGPSHDGILPRHGHGPQPQVIDGRTIIEGVDFLRALDPTGVWKAYGAAAEVRTMSPVSKDILELRINVTGGVQWVRLGDVAL